MQRRALYILRGLPGSGKTTWAVRKLNKDKGSTVRVNRDAIREMLHPNREWTLNFEDTVSSCERALIKEAWECGHNVIVDNNHVTKRHVTGLVEEWAPYFKIYIVDEFLRRRISTCIRRDAQRGQDGGKSVGEAVIRKQAERMEL